MKHGGSRRHRTGLAHAKKKSIPGVRNDINVTPLVDVCLVLLIIFMVIAPMLQRGRDVPLPKTKNFDEKEDLGQQPIVSIAIMSGQPAYWFNKDRVEGATEPERLDNIRKKTEDELAKSAKLEKPITRVFIKADINLSFKDVYPVLVAVHEGRSDGVELGVWEVDKGEE